MLIITILKFWPSITQKNLESPGCTEIGDRAALNLAEFVYFFSGAAGRNLIGQARIAFKWNANDDSLLEQDRRNYPGVRYPR